MVNDHLGLPDTTSRPGSPSVHKMPSSEAMRQQDEEGIRSAFQLGRHSTKADSDSFDSPQEEAAHYREKYRRILDMLDETRAELGTLSNVYNKLSQRG